MDNYLTSSVIGIGAMVAFVLWMLWMQKRHPDKRPGDIINYIFLREKVSTLVLMMVFINLGEAIWAAAISPKGEVQISSVSRFFIHFSIQLMSIIGGIYTPAGIRRILKVKGKAKIPHILVTLVFFTIAIVFPYLNTLLISIGLKETHNLSLIIYGEFNRATQTLSYAFGATVVVWFIHYFLIFADGILILANSSDDIRRAADESLGVGKDINEKINERGERAAQREENKNKDNNAEKTKTDIEYLLKKYKFKDTDSYRNKVNAAMKVIDKLPSATQSKLATRVYKVTKEVKELNEQKKGKNIETRTQLNKKAVGKIYDLFVGSTTSGNGFGMRLHKHSPNEELEDEGE